MAKEKFVKDPNYFGYREGQTLNIEGDALLRIFSFLVKVAEKERVVTYPLPFNEDGTPIPPKEVMEQRKVEVTEDGLAAHNLANYLWKIHTEAVESGKALHQQVLMEEAAKKGSALKIVK